ncbi:hypothetical protein B9Z19DRAFT_1010293, partial [Tuber borchii]
FIEFIELQDPNLKLEVNLGHRSKEKEDYNGSELKISKDGYNNLIKMYTEIEKRTTERDRVDLTYGGDSQMGYGCIEVLENQIRQYKSEKKSKHTKLKLYAIVEALVFFEDGPYRDQWTYLDMGGRFNEFGSLIGALFLDCFRELEKETPTGPWLAAPDNTPLKNLGLIMGLAIGAAPYQSFDGPDDWPHKIERMAQARGIQLRNCNGPFEEIEECDFETQVCQPPSSLASRVGVMCLLTTTEPRLKWYTSSYSVGGNKEILG